MGKGDLDGRNGEEREYSDSLSERDLPRRLTAPARSHRRRRSRGSRNSGTKTHAKPRPRSVSWWLLALKEQSPGSSVRDLSLSRDGPHRPIGVLRAELSHLPPRFYRPNADAQRASPRFVLSPFRLSHDPIAECPPGQVPEKLILDGQQRLTTLTQALSLDKPVRTQTAKRKKIKRYYYFDIQKVLAAPNSLDDAVVAVDENRQLRSDFGRRVDLDLSTTELECQHLHFPCNQIMVSDDWGNHPVQGGPSFSSGPT